MKKMIHYRLIFICILFLIHCSSFAQSKQKVIKNIQDLMLEHYIFLDKAKEANQHLDKLMEQNYFAEYTSNKELAKALSSELQKITKDRHLNIAPPREQDSSTPTPNSNFISRHLQNVLRFRSARVKEISFFENNVGYMNLTGFVWADTTKIDAAMQQLATADAIIIDVRQNGGGSGANYLSSYFFEEEGLLLESIYTRKGNKTNTALTVPVKGQKRPDVPLFILTGERTFSAAEAFTYDIQSRKRATIIGEVTGGGAHPVRFFPLGEGFGIILPIARSINPITKTNWEGVGVQPDIKATTEKSLDTAKELAQKAAQEYRTVYFEELGKLLTKTTFTQEEEAEVLVLFQKILKRKLMENFMINDMGYSYLRNKQLTASALIFKINTVLFPNSPNVHDSYAEVLEQTGQSKLALKHYQKAVELAKNQNDRRLHLFQKNLDQFQKK